MATMSESSRGNPGIAMMTAILAMMNENGQTAAIAPCHHRPSRR